jgi:signal transduction histidine kinase/predicted negative regulator of RcsB-dependent stress response
MVVLFRLIIAFTFLGMITGCGHQSEESESGLKRGLNPALNDSLTKLDSLVRAMKGKDNQLALKYARKELALAGRMNTEEAYANAYLSMGSVYTHLSKDSSFIYNSKALKIAQKLNMEYVRNSALYNIALLYYYASDQKMALVYLDSVIRLADRIKDYSTVSNAYNTIGNIQIDLSDSVSARKMYDSSLSIARKHSLSRQAGIAIESLAVFEKDPVVGTLMGKQAIAFLKQKPGAEEAIAHALTNLGLLTANPDTAIMYYLEAIKVAKNINSLALQIAVCNNLAYSFLDKGDVGKADSCIAQIAIPLAEKSKNLDWLPTLYDTYADILITQNKIARAFEYERKALNAKAKADSQLAADHVRLLAALLDVKNKEAIIADDAIAMQKQEIHLQQMRFWLLLSVLIMVGFLSFLVWFRNKSRMKIQLEKIASARKIFEIEEQEKRKLAKDLHDTVGHLVQGLTAHIASIQLSDPEINKGIKGKLNELGDNIRRISHHMSTVIIEKSSLEELMTGLCEDFQSLTGLKIEYRIPSFTYVFSYELKLHQSRILQEMLTNAHKYATKANVTISFAIVDKNLLFLYTDDGPGFEKDKVAHRSLGIINITERVKLLDGTVKLQTSPGFGTTWEITMPLPINDKRNVEVV